MLISRNVTKKENKYYKGKFYELEQKNSKVEKFKTLKISKIHIKID